MKAILYIGIALVVLLSIVALGGNADKLPYLGILIIIVLIAAWFKKAA